MHPRLLARRRTARIEEPVEVVAQRGRGIPNRMEFFRCALGHDLNQLGAAAAAAI